MNKLLIVGDSLSYNSYDFDAIPFSASAECFADIHSWSYSVRNDIISNSKNFVYGANMKGSHLDLENRVFGKLSFCGVKSDTFFYPYETNSITLYLQKHPYGGQYKISVDDGGFVGDIDFKGDPGIHHGSELFSILLPANGNVKCHKIEFVGSGIYTMLGIAIEEKSVVISGKGSQKVSFFIENYDEYIGNYDFDTIAIILGANDIKQTEIECFGKDYDKLIEMILAQYPQVDIIMLMPPSMENIDEPNLDEVPFTSVKTASPYCEKIKETAKKHKCRLLDTWQAFENVPINVWRYDNVHMTRLGNDIIHKKMMEFLEQTK